MIDSPMIVQYLLVEAAAHLPIADGLGTGRLIPTAAAVVGLVGVVVGGLALARSTGRQDIDDGRVWAITALVMAMISAVVGALHALNSAGGFGTGNGLAGAIVALAAGLAGMATAGLALARSRRARRPDHGAGPAPSVTQ